MDYYKGSLSVFFCSEKVGSFLEEICANSFGLVYGFSRPKNDSFKHEQKTNLKNSSWAEKLPPRTFFGSS